MWLFSQLACREHIHSPWQETNSSMTFTAVCVCSQTHLKRQCDISDIPSFAGGPFNMAEMNKATVHASERVSARDMIQTQFEGDEDLSLMTDKDVAKMKKKAEKDERAARAALAAHQVRPSHFCMTIDTCLFAFQVVVLECNTRSSAVCSARRLAVHLCITSSFVRFQPRHFSSDATFFLPDQEQ